MRDLKSLDDSRTIFEEQVTLQFRPRDRATVSVHNLIFLVTSFISYVRLVVRALFSEWIQRSHNKTAEGRHTIATNNLAWNFPYIFRRLGRIAASSSPLPTYQDHAMFACGFLSSLCTSLLWFDMSAAARIGRLVHFSSPTPR